MKFVKALSMSLLFSISGWAAPTPDYSTLAKVVYLQQEPVADLMDVKVKEQIGYIQTEIETLLNEVMTPEGRNNFSLSLPWKTEILISFEKPLLEELKKQADSQGMIDLTQVPVNPPELAKAFADAHAEKIDLNRSSYSLLTLKSEANARRSSIVIGNAKVQGVRYAEPNSMIGGRSLNLVRTRVPGATLYVLGFSWGDCPAVCIYSHRRYYELTYNGVTSVGLSGEPLAGSANEGRDYSKWLK